MFTSLNIYLLETPLELQKALVFFPGPWWLWLIGVILGILGAIVKSEKTEGKSLSVLGMQGAGKTQLYNMLKGKYGVKTVPTGTEPYNSFEIKLKDRTVVISDGKDIGGSETYIKQYYKDMIFKNDIIIFIFNIKLYLNDRNEKRLVNARLEHLYEHCKNNKNIDKNVVIIGSFADKLSKDELKDASSKLLESVGQKDYAKLFKTNVFIIDITNKEQVKDMAEKIF